MPVLHFPPSPNMYLCHKFEWMDLNLVSGVLGAPLMRYFGFNFSSLSEGREVFCRGSEVYIVPGLVGFLAYQIWSSGLPDLVIWPTKTSGPWVQPSSGSGLYFPRPPEFPQLYRLMSGGFWENIFIAMIFYFKAFNAGDKSRTPVFMSLKTPRWCFKIADI